MLDPRPSDSAPSGRTASSGFLQEPTASMPIRKPGTSGFSRLTPVSRMRTFLSSTAFPSSTAVSPGCGHPQSFPQAFERALDFRKSRRLQGKASPCVFNAVRFLLSGSVLRCDSVLLARYCIFSAHTSCEGGQGRETASSISPLALRHCGGRLAERNRSVYTPLPAMSGLDAPCRRFLASATARSRPDRPRLRLACSRPRQCCCLCGWRTRSFRITPRFGIETGIYSYYGHSVKSFDGMADFQ